MQNTLGVVHVRLSLANAPDKLARKLGGMPLLELVVRRLTDCERLAGVVVLADDQHLDAIRPLVPPDVPVCQFSARDPLAGFAGILDEYSPDSLIRVAADNPYIDPVLVDRLVNTAAAHSRCDYISYSCADGRPTMQSPIGVVAEWCRSEAIRRAHREAKRPADRQSVTGFLYSHPELFNVRLIPLPAELDRDDLRLRIDIEEDWEHAHAIYEALGTHDCDWQRIADLLDHQPAMRSRMAHLNRASA